MKIEIRYNHPEEDILEIDFYRGETLLHNVFYDIEGLNEDELRELKLEAIAKFSTVFPNIAKKDIMKGFSAVDKQIEKLYQETFNPRNAGRKKGVKIGKIKPETVTYYRRVTPDEKDFLDKKLEEYRQQKSSS